jgi:hypothetical protein
MNITRPFLCVAFLLTTPFLLARDPDAFFCVKPQTVEQTAFVKKLTALPEWNAARTTLAGVIDKSVNATLTNRKQLEERLPAKLADQIASKVEERGSVSIYEVIAALREHLEAVVVLAEETDSHGFVGAIALIGDVNPADGLPWLPTIDGISEGKDYKFLKTESDGDFIIQTSRKVMDRNVEICCAGVKLPGNNRYALIFSNGIGIQKYCDAFKKGQTGEEFAKGYAQKLIVSDRSFRALEKFGQKQDWPARAMEACGKIKGVEFGFRDIDGATQIEAKLSLKQEDDAKLVRDLVLGTGMFIQLAAVAKEEVSDDTKDLARQAANFFQTIQAEANGTDVVVTLKLDGDDFWKIISDGLKKTNDELKQHKDFSSLRDKDWRGWFDRHVKSIIK